MGYEFSKDFSDSLEETFGRSEGGLGGRFLGYVRVISKAFQAGETWGTQNLWDLWKGPKE